MIRYKLVTQDYKTRKGRTNETTWEIGKRVEADMGVGMRLCGPGVVHAYADPLLAVMMNPTHANLKNPRMFEVECSDPEVGDGTKLGYRSMTPVKEVDCPAVTMEQRVAFGILCAKEVCEDEKWNEWADRWLSGEDRSINSARAAYSAAYAAARAAESAAVAVAAYSAAESAESAAEDGHGIDFIGIAKEAMKY